LKYNFPLIFLIVVWQGIAVLVSAILVGLAWGQAGWGVLYGGAVSMVGAWLLAWRWRKGVHDYHCDGHRHLKSLHRSFLERLFVVAGLLAMGLWLGSGESGPGAWAILLGFVVGQLTWVVAAAGLKTE